MRVAVLSNGCSAGLPAIVQLCSLDRPPADPGILNVPRERLLAMAAAIREALPRSVVDIY